MASAVGDIGSAELHAFAPLVEIELAFGKLDIDAAEPDALAVDAGKIGLAADPGAIAAVERVVPDVELPGGGRVDGRDEVDGVMHHVDDVFVGADAVKLGHFVAGKLLVGDLQPPARVRKAHDAALRLAPLEHRQVPAWPFLDAGRARVVVFLEPQQAEVAGVRRREAGDLDVVAHQVVLGGKRVDLAIEELLLGIPARAPGEDAADVEVFTQDVPPHVFGLHAFGRAFVVSAAGGVHVVVAGVPPHLGQVNPALELKRPLNRFGPGDGDRSGLLEVFGPASDRRPGTCPAAARLFRRSGGKSGGGRRSRARGGGWARDRFAPRGRER